MLQHPMSITWNHKPGMLLEVNNGSALIITTNADVPFWTSLSEVSFMMSEPQEVS